MRIVLLVMVASLADACVMEEPINEPQGMSWSEADVSWSEADLESQAEIESRPIVWRPSCAHHFKCCHDTKLGTTYDDYNRTRCYFCADRCEQERQWPRETYAGRDCEYWKRQYEIRPPARECL